MKFRVIIRIADRRYESKPVASYRQAYGAVVELLNKGYDAYVEHVFPEVTE